MDGHLYLERDPNTGRLYWVDAAAKERLRRLYDLYLDALNAGIEDKDREDDIEFYNAAIHYKEAGQC